MRCQIKTRRSEGILTFRASAAGKYNYVYLMDSNFPGERGRQICEGGDFRGHCLTCGPSEESLKTVARKWRRQRKTLLDRDE